MFRRGLTVVAWLVGLAAVTYEDVVAPIAHAAFGARVTQERVHEAEPDAVQNDSFAARIAPALKDQLNWEMDAAEARIARAVAAHAAGTKVRVARAVAAQAAVGACDDLAEVVAKSFEGWL